MSGTSRAAIDGPAGGDRPVVEAVNISKRFGSTVALSEAGIVVRRGETHALVGRNGAGKSTLVSILSGLTAADAGAVAFDGRPAPPLGDRDAWRQRLACVYQKSTIIPTLTVAENLFLNRHARGSGRLIRWSELRRDAERLLATWSVEVDVRQPASTLSVEQRQFVEIARALSFGARFIILDEPTAQLDGAGISRLFTRIRDLRAQGVTFLFISHHLQEVYEICDQVTVFRDARHIVTAPVAELSRQALVAAMTGEDVTMPEADRRPPSPGAAVLLSVRDLVTRSGAEISLEVKAGEVVGIAGGGGSGKVEVAEAIVGLSCPAGGIVAVDGRVLRPGSVPDALAAGVGLVPQDRHREGLVPLLSIAENVTMTVPHRVGRHGIISPARRDGLARRTIADLAIKASGPQVPVSDLSGGNQQKVVMGRALASHPKLLVLITPTAGVDVRSKQTLLGVVEDVRRRGTAVLVVSDELDDLRICDRVAVMFQGRVVHETAQGWSDNDLVAAMEGVDLHHV
ncbi:simple sugar transport system ATP-binding protein [Micromonospora phaseoli]|uniref:Simple sugar transport system ATP-binding protein n=1 Tax=Micromonospora phaseoli TaxID=1144548 RepID=A0A1H6V7B6_9ACTN|nr:sugar ABC transporter ATP-binding protein [Micromonospora phaseoli]PZV93837.1 simple sugar transport system ATP-binding protein [Micromonospora phaseoli]GIJ80720.1 multidrug ABC transporter ATP-binding protein [Micromonospora phaseoli]SEI96155.1 simple sugar transport system ATP-binding protein [Micromonospora phaseoli]